MGTTNDDRTSQDWFEIEGRPMDVRELRGASGQACRVPLGPRFDATLARWSDQPGGIVLAHACALSAVAIVNRLASTWPHRDFPGNAERDWRDVLSLTGALRHVHRIQQRSRDGERRMRAMQRDGWRIGADNEALQPLVDLDAFEACGMPCCPLPSTVGAPEPFGDDQLRTTLASHHHAVAVVAGDVLWILELALAHAGALRPREDWRDAIARCGTKGPELVRAAWQASANAVARGADFLMPGGSCYRRPSVWPSEYWPAWHGIENMLAAEMARTAAGGTVRQRLAPKQTKTKEPRLRPGELDRMAVNLAKKWDDEGHPYRKTDLAKHLSRPVQSLQRRRCPKLAMHLQQMAKDKEEQERYLRAQMQCDDRDRRRNARTK